MIREIITDEEILSKPCDAATAADAAIADDLVETLLASDEAVCLAANQIGETKRIVAYLNEAGRPQVMYNPRVTQKLKPYTAVEACLSREEPTAVTRYDWVRVSYDPAGQTVYVLDELRRIEAGQGVNDELLDTIQMIATIMNGMQEDFAYDR